MLGRKRGEIHAVLQVLDEAGAVVGTWPLKGRNTYRLGRGAGNDVALSCPSISRNHAMIQVEASGVCNLIDLGSANGTFVDGRRIYTPTMLRSGCLMGLGKARIVFRQDRKQELPAVTADEVENATVAFLDRETVTVLVCDLRDFTRYSEALGVGAVSRLLQHWAKNVDALVKEHNGMVDKFIGDAVMAIWPGRQEIRRNIVQALRTALAIADFTSALGRRVPGLGGELRIGAALNTGEAAVGNIGGDARRDFTAVGDTVNVAFRLEEMTSKLGLDLLMGEATAGFLGDAADSFQLERCALRGKEEVLLARGGTFAQLRGYLGSIRE